MRNVATTGKRVGYGWLYNWYAVDTGLLLPQDPNENLDVYTIANDWVSGLMYMTGIYVNHNGYVYKAKDDTGEEPPHDDYWEVDTHNYDDLPYPFDKKIFNPDDKSLSDYVGWKVPSNAEWIAMTDHLSTNIGGKLKSTRNEWNSPNTGATDEFGFAALPGGLRSSTGNFSDLGTHGSWWSATEDTSAEAWSRYMRQNNSNVTRSSYDKKIGFSVRCIQEKKSGENDKDIGTVTDMEGNTYKWVVIGNHRWMAENLRVTEYADGSSIPECFMDSRNSDVWDSGTQYYRGDKVTHTHPADVYMAVEDNKDEEPTWEIVGTGYWYPLRAWDRLDEMAASFRGARCAYHPHHTPVDINASIPYQFQNIYRVYPPKR